MADEQKPRTEKIENLELNKETIQDLTEGEAEKVGGGLLRAAISLAGPGFDTIGAGCLDATA
jgi:hypothetical protein